MFRGLTSDTGYDLKGFQANQELTEGSELKRDFVTGFRVEKVLGFRGLGFRVRVKRVLMA